MGLGILSKLEVEHPLQTYDTYPRAIMIVAGLSVLIPPLFIVLPFIFFRDVMWLNKRYEVEFEDSRYLFYVLPILLHAFSIVPYFWWRRDKLQRTYNVTDSQIERKQNEEFEIEHPQPLYGALMFEGILVAISSFIIILNQFLVVAYVTMGLLLVTSVIANPILVYDDMKTIATHGVPWNRRMQLVTLILSTSVVFLFGYILSRNQRLWTLAFNSVRDDQKNIGTEEVSKAEMKKDRSLDFEEKEIFKKDNSPEERRKKERTSDGSVFEDMDDNN